MSATDLFGDPVRPPVKGPIPAGYGGIPGTGPAGETCATCKHHYRKQMASVYHKCLLAKHLWTGGTKSDIRVRTPACNRWESAASAREMGEGG
jgi:hypothetical protein